MWKRQDQPAGGQPASSNPSNPPMPYEPPHPPTASPISERAPQPEPEPRRNSVAHIGKSVRIKGELTGSEDLYIDGQVEGVVQLKDYYLTVGPSGKVQANVNAKKVMIHGSVRGNICASDSVTIGKTGSLIGDLIVAGVVIEDGAYFKGSIDIQKAADSDKSGGNKKANAPAQAQPQLAAVGGNRP